MLVLRCLFAHNFVRSAACFPFQIGHLSAKSNNAVTISVVPALGINVSCSVLLTTLLQQRSDTPILHEGVFIPQNGTRNRDLLRGQRGDLVGSHFVKHAHCVRVPKVLGVGCQLLWGQNAFER